MVSVSAVGNYYDVEDVLRNGRIHVSFYQTSAMPASSTTCSAWWISSYPRTEGSQIQRHTLVPSNITTSTQISNTSAPSTESSTFLHHLLTHPSVHNLSADILSGQIIASVIVLGFVAVFLLREWISQNARPGVFDDAEAPPEGVVPPPQPAIEQEQPAPIAPPPPAPAPVPKVAASQVPDDTTPAQKNDNPSDVSDTRDGGRRKIRRVEPEGPTWTKKGKEPAHGNLFTTPKRRHSWEGSASPRSSPVQSNPGLSLNPDQAQFTFTVPTPSSDKPTQHLEPPKLEPVPTPVPLPTPLRRPPLPAFTVPSSPSSPSGMRSRVHTPLASPSLATYRPPEELEAGPSSLSSYFQSDSPPKTLIEDLKDEHHHYFREPVQEATSQQTGSEGTSSHVPVVDIPDQQDHELSRWEEDDDNRTLDNDSSSTQHSPETPPLGIADQIPDLALASDQEDDIEDDEDDEGIVMPFRDGLEVVEAEPRIRGRAAPLAAAIPARPAQQGPPLRAEQDVIEQEEIDAAMEDDMDGALEGQYVAGCSL